MKHRNRLEIPCLALIATVALLFSGCEELLNETSGSIRLEVYSEQFSPDELDASLNIDSIVQIDPAINGQSVFVSDGAGTITIQDVPPGSYSIHPAFYGTSNDVFLNVSAGNEAQETIELPRAGLYYYIVNTQSAVGSLGDATVRRALGIGIDRQGLVDAISDSPTPALNLIPLELRNDGVTGLDSIVESTAAAESALTGTPAFSFGVLHNTIDSGAHAAIAAEFKAQVEALSAVSSVSITGQAWETYLETRDQFGFDVARAGWFLDSNNIHNFLQELVAQSGLEEPSVSARIDEAELSLINGDLADYAVNVVDAHDLLVEQMAVIPIYFY